MRRQKSLARDVLVLSSIQADYMLYTKQTLALLALMPLALFAQKDVVSAYNANQDGDYLKAAEFIDKAIEDPKANVKEKTWRYRANIYTNLAADSTLYTQVPDALEKAAESLIKADEHGFVHLETRRCNSWASRKRKIPSLCFEKAHGE